MIFFSILGQIFFVFSSSIASVVEEEEDFFLALGGLWLPVCVRTSKTWLFLRRFVPMSFRRRRRSRKEEEEERINPLHETVRQQTTPRDWIVRWRETICACEIVVQISAPAGVLFCLIFPRKTCEL